MRWVITRSEPQVLVQPVSIHDLARIHLASWIPDRLEFAKRLHQLRTEHLRQQLRVDLPIAMPPKKCPAILHDEVGCRFEECTEIGNPRGRPQIVVDPDVETALTEMTEESATVVVLLH